MPRYHITIETREKTYPPFEMDLDASFPVREVIRLLKTRPELASGQGPAMERSYHLLGGAGRTYLSSEQQIGQTVVAGGGDLVLVEDTAPWRTSSATGYLRHPPPPGAAMFPPMAPDAPTVRLPNQPETSPQSARSYKPTYSRQPSFFWQLFALLGVIGAGAILVALVMWVLSKEPEKIDETERDTTSEPPILESANNLPPTSTLQPTSTPLPTPVRTNPLFPVTIAEWRSELSQQHAQHNETSGQCAGYWCSVPSGEYRIGGWLDDGNESNDAEAHISLSEFWIAKYPVTVQQYRYFMEEEGYSKTYWTERGWTWKTVSYRKLEESGGRERTNPYWWDVAHFTDNNQPVIGVVWYEAMAFASWLNEQLASSLPANYQVRLPTEAEWETAAIYDKDEPDKRRTYPWGNAPQPSSRYADFGKNGTTHGADPVGDHREGSASCGAQNMVGSVWEWTASRKDQYPSDSGLPVSDVKENARITLRGGSFVVAKEEVRGSARSDCAPVDYGFNGFRLVLAPPNEQ